MDLLKLATDIQTWLDTQEFSYSVGEKNDEKSGAFLLRFGDELSGFVSYEDNQDDLEFATVSVGILLADLSDSDAGFLRQLLGINASLFGANLVCGANDDGSHDLYMQMRLAAEDLESEQIAEAISSLLAQIQRFLGPLMEPIEEEAVEETVEEASADEAATEEVASEETVQAD
jgi:hypothetical protein